MQKQPNAICFLENEDQPQIFSQGDLKDLVRDLTLSNDKAELLAPRLKEKSV